MDIKSYLSKFFQIAVLLLLFIYNFFFFLIFLIYIFIFFSNLFIFISYICNFIGIEWTPVQEDRLYLDKGFNYSFLGNQIYFYYDFYRDYIYYIEKNPILEQQDIIALNNYLIESDNKLSTLYNQDYNELIRRSASYSKCE